MRSLFFTDEVGPIVILDGDEGHHAADVVRVRVGEEIDVSDTKRFVHAQVTAVSKGRVEARILNELQIPDSKPHLTIAQALIKGDSMAESVDLMTQVGVDQIIPWIAERSIVQWDASKAEKNLTKLKATALEASKQSRRPTIPKIDSLLKANELAEKSKNFDRVIALHESGEEHLAGIGFADESVLMIVGPEGGLSDAEIALFNAEVRRIGPTVIRSAHAGAIAAAVVFASNAWR